MERLRKISKQAILVRVCVKIFGEVK